MRSTVLPGRVRGPRRGRVALLEAQAHSRLLRRRAPSRRSGRPRRAAANPARPRRCPARRKGRLPLTTIGRTRVDDGRREGDRHRRGGPGGTFPPRRFEATRWGCSAAQAQVAAAVAPAAAAPASDRRGRRREARGGAHVRAARRNGGTTGSKRVIAPRRRATRYDPAHREKTGNQKSTDAPRHRGLASFTCRPP